MLAVQLLLRRCSNWWFINRRNSNYSVVLFPGNATTVTASGAVTGGSLTDGTMTISSGSITGADDITSTGDLSVGGNATITGNLTVNGTLTSISTTNTEIQDNVILLNDGESGAGVTGGTSGIEVDRGSSDNADFVFDESDDTWKARINGTDLWLLAT